MFFCLNGTVARLLLIALISVGTTFPVVAQDSLSARVEALTAEDYAQAEQFMSYNTAPLVSGATVRPTWLENDRFWYRNITNEGAEFVLVDPLEGRRQLAFDHARLAEALSAATTSTYRAEALPFEVFDFASDGQTVVFDLDDQAWRCDVGAAECVTGTQGAAGSHEPSRNDAISPDGRLAAYLHDHNIWVRNQETGEETQVTFDGVENLAYATDNAGWRRSDRPIVVWSPDSKKLATFLQDQQDVGKMHLVETRVGHPILHSWVYPLPGDEVITTIQRVVVDVEEKRVIRFLMPADQHRSTLCDDLPCRGVWQDVQWHPDSSRVAFVSTSRDHKQAHLRIADAVTGEIRDLFEEVVETFFESGNGMVNWRYLPRSNEIIWFSQRDEWGHLYLYDLQSGELKQQITTGVGNVTQLLRVDEENRLLYFLGVGREPGRNPYYRHLYRVGFDGQQLRLLTPEDGDHNVTLSPSGQFFIDRNSEPDVPPVATLRAADGQHILTLEQADLSRLTATGWRPPLPFTVKARDGVTDLHGLLFRPTNFDEHRQYPIINQIYPGPQTGSVRGRSFAASRGDAQALAELGFVVVQIDGMGTPWRSKSFHEAYYGDMGDNTLPDQVTGMQQLAARFAWIDLERAGIYGHSGGGYATAAAMFRYPDFFKVGVSGAGNHDNRVYEDDWGEKWQGLLTRSADGSTNYDNQANQNIAENLSGKLLLAHGTMDTNVPVYNTLLVVDALIKANKDFDLLLLPNRGHGFGNEPYWIRKRWDYFVRHLLGAEPPQGYALRPASSTR